MEPAVSITQDQFFDLCQQNNELRLERTAHGELIVMPPASGGSSARNLSVGAQLYFWAERNGTGMAFDSSGGFILPNGAIRSPDASWVSQAQMAFISDEQLDKFLPLCPDFLIEILSPTDSLRQTAEKMEEYITNGAKLGWLINPRNKNVHVYRPGLEVQILENPTSLSGDPELAGFVLNLEAVWEPR
jgi:Uma2 family endonuclease